MALFGHFVGRAAPLRRWFAAPIVRCCPVSGPRGCVSSDRCLLVSRWSDRSGFAGGPPLWRSSPLEGVDSTGVRRDWVCLVVCGWNAPRRREESRRGTMSARATTAIDVATNGDTAGKNARATSAKCRNSSGHSWLRPYVHMEESWPLRRVSAGSWA